MWEWITLNAVWIIIISGLILVLLFFTRDRVRDSIVKTPPKKRRGRMDRSVTAAFWTLEGIALAIIVIAGVALVVSQEGVGTIVTTETIQRWFLEHGTMILAILVLGAGLWLALKRFAPRLVQRSVARPKRGESLQGMKKRADTLTGVFTGLGKALIVISVVFMILSEMGVPIGPILAGFGIAGIAVGFGAQYLIRDLIAGVFVLMENQYRVGDVARVADTTGVVEEVNLRKTVLRDLDGIVHHVPNGEIKVASNFTRHFSRVNLDVSVSYGTDLDHAIGVINRVGQELAADKAWAARIMSAPQVLRVNKFGDSGIDIKIVGDVKPLEQWATMGELRLRLKKAFDAEDIEIPWPHVKLYFGQTGANELVTCQSCSQPNRLTNKFCSQCGASLHSG